MEVMHPRCAGLDVHKDTVVAAVRCVSAPQHHEVRSFATTTTDLLALADWLGAHGCTHVAMEATGVYWKEADRQAFEAEGVRYRVNRRAAAPHKPLSERWRAINRARSRTRARGEHPFHVIKRLWGFAKVRYRGLAKNLARAFSLFALANLYLVRRQLLPPQARCVV
jgi:IS5 family transposase